MTISFDALPLELVGLIAELVWRTPSPEDLVDTKMRLTAPSHTRTLNTHGGVTLQWDTELHREWKRTSSHALVSLYLVYKRTQEVCQPFLNAVLSGAVWSNKAFVAHPTVVKGLTAWNDYVWPDQNASATDEVENGGDEPEPFHTQPSIRAWLAKSSNLVSFTLDGSNVLLFPEMVELLPGGVDQPREISAPFDSYSRLLDLIGRCRRLEMLHLYPSREQELDGELSLETARDLLACISCLPNLKALEVVAWFESGDFENTWNTVKSELARPPLERLVLRVEGVPFDVIMRWASSLSSTLETLVFHATSYSFTEHPTLADGLSFPALRLLAIEDENLNGWVELREASFPSNPLKTIEKLASISPQLEYLRAEGGFELADGDLDALAPTLRAHPSLKQVIIQTSATPSAETALWKMKEDLMKARVSCDDWTSVPLIGLPRL